MRQVRKNHWKHAWLAAAGMFVLVGCKTQKPADANNIPEQPQYSDKADSSAKPAATTSSWKEAGDSSAAPAPVTTAAATPTGSRTHTVKKGDTIYSLARLYYSGDVHKWHSIFDANRDKLANPDQLKVGQVLVIPG